LGAVTPLGGVCFLIGWAILAAAATQLMSQEGAPADGPPPEQKP
jgi:hypothetical protein